MNRDTAPVLPIGRENGRPRAPRTPVGILLNNSRLVALEDHFNRRLSDHEAHFNQRLADQAEVYRAEIRPVMNKLDDIATRLTRLKEDCRSRR
jgi:hypothetical protein